MIGTTFIILVVICGLFLTPFNRPIPYGIRHKLKQERIAKMEVKRKKKAFAAHGWKYDKNANIEFTGNGISFKGGVRIQPSLKAKLKMRLRDKDIKIVAKITLSLIVVVGLFQIVGFMSFIALGAAFTDKANGDWDATGQTTWNEANYPVTGDTVTISTYTIRIDSGTGNEACLSCVVEGGGTLTIDSESSGALSLTYDDNASAGFGASAGTLNCIGTSGNIVTITGDGTPPTNKWDFDMSMVITADYTTFSYFGQGVLRTGAKDIDNCTFYRGAQLDIYSGTITSFDNVTIDGMTTGVYSTIIRVALSADNLRVINYTGTYDIWARDSKTELTNSNFNEAKVYLVTTGDLISDTHNDIAGDYYIWSTDLSKSSITNDYGTGDSVIIYSGTFVVDESSACFDLDIKSGATFKIDAVAASVSLTHKFDDTINAGFVGTAVGTFNCIGNGTYSVTVTSAAIGDPTNFWKFYANLTALTADYTTFSYFDEAVLKGTIDIDDCTFADGFNRIQLSASTTLISFSNNTSDALKYGIYENNGTHTNIDNLIITNTTVNDVLINTGHLEMTNCNFDETDVNLFSTGDLISKDHNDISGDWYFWGTSRDKSSVTNDYGTGDSVVIYEGLLTVDEASACFTLLIMTGATWKVDAVGASASITHTFDDSSGAGFVETADFDGTLLCVGNGTYGVTLTTAAAGTPTYYWNADINVGTLFTMNFTYTTIEYYNHWLGRYAICYWDNVTCQKSSATGYVIVVAYSQNTYQNVTVNSESLSVGITFSAAPTMADNFTFLNPVATVIDIFGNQRVEMTNSNFDETKNVNWRSTGDGKLISDNHNDVSGDYIIWVGTSGTLNKSSITNDFGATDNVTIYEGKVVADETMEHTDMTIKSGGELEVNQGINWTITHTTGRFTVESGGTIDCNGITGNRITLASSTPTTQYEWDIQSGATQEIAGVHVTDCDASIGLEVDASDGTSYNNGNNDNWDFGTYKVEGYTRDQTGTILGSCIVDLFSATDESKQDSTTSNAVTGYYIFTGLTVQSPYYLRAYKSDTPNVFGTTKRTVAGVAE